MACSRGPEGRAPPRMRARTVWILLSLFVVGTTAVQEALVCKNTTVLSTAAERGSVSVDGPSFTMKSGNCTMIVGGPGRVLTLTNISICTDAGLALIYGARLSIHDVFRTLPNKHTTSII